MNREEFQNKIKDLPIDEMIEMCPNVIAFPWGCTFKLTTLCSYDTDDTVLCDFDSRQNMLLWLYDNNLLPWYQKDE